MHNITSLRGIVRQLVMAAVAVEVTALVGIIAAYGNGTKLAVVAGICLRRFRPFMTMMIIIFNNSKFTILSSSSNIVGE